MDLRRAARRGPREAGIALVALLLLGSVLAAPTPSTVSHSIGAPRAEPVGAAARVLAEARGALSTGHGPAAQRSVPHSGPRVPLGPPKLHLNARWTNLTSQLTRSVPCADAFAMTYDAKDQEVVFFGGYFGCGPVGFGNET